MLLKGKVGNRISNMECLIGNTPMLEITYRFRGLERKIYVKAEHYNLTGSIKDRMAFHIMRKSYQESTLKEGDIISEATSGNTGIAFAAIGNALGHDVVIYMPDWMSEERKNLIRSFGAKVELVSSEEGGFLGSIRMTEELRAKEGNVFLPYQFSNKYNIEAHYLGTGPEIEHQLDRLGLRPDGFVAGVGTGGTVMGIGSYLRKVNGDAKIYPLEPLSSPTLSTGYKVSKHRIQGVSDEFIPDIVDMDYLDEVIGVDDGDAIIMAQKLASVLGLGVGISSGANFLGGLIAQEKLGGGSTVVTVFPDDNKKYLSTDLMKTEPVKAGFLSGDVELLDMIAYR